MVNYSSVWFTIFYHGWVWLTLVDHGWLGLAMVDYGWLWLMMGDYGWPWVIMVSLVDYGWLWMTMVNYGWAWEKYIMRFVTRRTQRPCVEITLHILLDYDFGMHFLKGLIYIYITPHIGLRQPKIYFYLSKYLFSFYLIRLNYTNDDIWCIYIWTYLIHLHLDSAIFFFCMFMMIIVMWFHFGYVIKIFKLSPHGY
jgi:hypothetical protein